MEINKTLHAIPATFRKNENAQSIRGYDITEGHPLDGGKILFNLIPYNKVDVLANTSIEPDKLPKFAERIVKCMNEYDTLVEERKLLIAALEKLYENCEEALKNAKELLKKNDDLKRKERI